ncbi:hypothetical protein N9N38_03475 [Candidatus Pelagibacter bacterium]|nr:hypothetical protein [Candidatus Pelagibacter bacterium]MDA8841776.1 hypothetical protein [Candidatus Pelagibacter bacterium]
MKKKIAIVTENNKNSGNGHFRRMKGLFLYLKGKKEISKIFLLNKNYELTLIKKYEPDLIVCDFQSYNNKKYSSLYKIKNCKIMNIENYDNSNYDLNISVIDHNSKLTGKRVSGLNYAMIRPEIKKVNKKINTKSIFVNLGSTESKKKVKEISLSLKGLSTKFNFIFITKFYKHFNVTISDQKFKYYAPKFFLKYFNSSIINITNGGLTLIEALYLRKKIIIIPQTKYEKKFSNYLKKKTNNIDIGKRSINDKSINRLLRKKTKIVVDGLGYSRIYKVLSKF